MERSIDWVPSVGDLVLATGDHSIPTVFKVIGIDHNRMVHVTLFGVETIVGRWLPAQHCRPATDEEIAEALAKRIRGKPRFRMFLNGKEIAYADDIYHKVDGPIEAIQVIKT